jgi:hypothetical protein
MDIYDYMTCLNLVSGKSLMELSSKIAELRPFTETYGLVFKTLKDTNGNYYVVLCPEPGRSLAEINPLVSYLMVTEDEDNIGIIQNFDGYLHVCLMSSGSYHAFTVTEGSIQTLSYLEEEVLCSIK